jgi:hypothetical protein
MKLKNLRKKIRRLETRLREGPKKLAKLKRKLEAVMKADAEKARRKLANRPAVKVSPPTRNENPRSTAKPQKKPVVKMAGVARKAKRKLNLSPERRAQLAAAMKARWAAKRAAAEANPPGTSTDRDFTLGQSPQTP